MEGNEVDVLIYLIFLWSYSFLKSSLSDPVRLLASMAAIRCVFYQLATQGVETQLGKLAVGGVTQTKTKTDIPTQNTH